MATTKNFGATTTGEEVADSFAPQIHGKTILITGVSPGGLGAQFAEIIAKHHPKLLILAARDLSKAKATAQAISSALPDVQTRVLELDLGSQTQVRKAAEEVNAYEEAIDVLVNNAGVMGCPYSTTVDGLETHFGTNHIGHFLFTNLIMGKIISAGPGARVVSVSSGGHRRSAIRFDDPNFSVRQIHLTFLNYHMNMKHTSRAERSTINWRHTANPRQPIFCLLLRSPRSWRAKVYLHSAYILASSGRTWGETSPRRSWQQSPRW